MIIKAVKFYEHGFATQGFVMGGEEGADKYDSNVRYRSCLTNYVIDTGKEVILVDTGVPKESPEQVPDSNTAIYTGRCITDYVSALKAVGYTPDSDIPLIRYPKFLSHINMKTIQANSVLFQTQKFIYHQKTPMHWN